jgi:glycosyltransferase involved in cell wall biosynthesis
MAEAILQLALDPSKRAAFSSNALSAYDSQFTLKHTDGAYMKLYQKPERR